jgi:hypothetical protein
MQNAQALCGRSVNQGFATVRVDLAAQTIDVNVHHVSRRVKVHTPDVFGDHSSSNHAACVPAKVLQQRELMWRELEDALAAPRDRLSQAADQRFPSGSAPFVKRRIGVADFVSLLTVQGPV